MPVVPNEPYVFCGRKATLNLYVSHAMSDLLFTAYSAFLC